MCQCPKSHLDLLHPSVTSRVGDNQVHQKKDYDAHAKPQSFYINDPVLVLNTGKGPKWIDGTVTKQTGPCLTGEFPWMMLCSSWTILKHLTLGTLSYTLLNLCIDIWPPDVSLTFQHESHVTLSIWHFSAFWN